MTPLRITHRVRQPGRTDRELPGSEPQLAALLAELELRPDRRIFSGGEPCLHPNLPELLAAAAAPWLHTDAIALTQESALGALCQAGLAGVRVDLYSLDPGAHDWMVGQRGSLRASVRGIRQALEAGLSVEAEVVLVRPVVHQLADMIEGLSRLGIRRLRVRRIEARGAAAEDFIAVSPRLGLAQPFLEAAAAQARASGVRLRFVGFPACATGSASDLAVPVDATGPGCGRCPGAPQCAGGPIDYVERFGWTEIRSEDRPLRGSAAGADTPSPPPRAHRPPATRVRFAHLQLQRPDLGGDPVGGGVAPTPETVCLHLSPTRSTRSARREMAELGQAGARHLRILGAFEHPEGPALLRDSSRLAFETVTATGRVGRLLSWSREDCRAVRLVDRFVLTDASDADIEAARAVLKTVESTPRSEGCPCGEQAECPSLGVGWTSQGVP